MHDDEFERPGGEFGDEVSRMLRDRAAHHIGRGDAVALTRKHIAVAGTRRKAYSATAALAVVGGLVVGGQAFGSGPGTGSGDGTSIGAAGQPGRPTTAAPPKLTPTQNPVQAPAHTTTPAPLPPIDCSGLPKMPTAADFTWGARGSLAADADLGHALVARAAALTGGKNAKLAYAGEDGSTRVAVVFVDADHAPGCNHLLAVVFHGPAGTAADALGVQAGVGGYGVDYGFTWAERGTDGSMTLLAIDPPTVHSLLLAGTLDGSHTSTTNVSTEDGTLLETYPAGTPVPAWVEFGAPGTSTKGDQPGNPVSFVVAAGTREAYARAVGTSPSKVTQKSGMYVGPGGTYMLNATRDVQGTEHVFWSSFINEGTE
ncbi:hypothetical protein [Catenulispora subtropica]|uniref:Uncharacterized protein n=1 Tax=Catenulispora subtropica TaxID=450798 RepID=A0ABN2T5V7_9ACTN